MFCDIGAHTRREIPVRRMKTINPDNQSVLTTGDVVRVGVSGHKNHIKQFNRSDIIRMDTNYYPRSVL